MQISHALTSPGRVQASGEILTRCEGNRPLSYRTQGRHSRVHARPHTARGSRQTVTEQTPSLRVSLDSACHNTRDVTPPLTGSHLSLVVYSARLLAPAGSAPYHNHTTRHVLFPCTRVSGLVFPALPASPARLCPGRLLSAVAPLSVYIRYHQRGEIGDDDDDVTRLLRSPTPGKYSRPSTRRLLRKTTGGAATGYTYRGLFTLLPEFK
ncbi:unnamed protein product [Danaus chrysippus]|uniref:(African queen) hypothetical protein n=1 Tax=Danaus chrysippus TaxID=151541 RepID=A0A8J2W3F1_9NEOP|nr:unnamed protein product [Danaus chrysippus]